MKKRYVFKSGFLPMLIITVAMFIIFISWEEKTPVIENVTVVYLEFEADELLRSDGSKYIGKEITDPTDKEFLINFFSNEYELYDLSCTCPRDNIKVIFESDKTVWTFGVGVIGCGNVFNYNSNKYVGIPYEQYKDLMVFFSKFDETAVYGDSNIVWFK